MKVYFTVKSASKKKNYINKKEFTFKTKPSNLQEIIMQIVEQNVSEYNNKIVDQSVIPFLTNEEINDLIQNGKVGFNTKYNEKNEDLQKAINTAIIGFVDGLFKVFLNETEIATLEESIDINEEDTIVFVKFVMLSGRMW